jgi:hypothetical protein
MDCWKKVQQLDGETLHTLARPSDFKIIAVDDTQVLLRLSTGKARPVQRKGIEGAFRELVRTGKIDQKAIEKRHSPRGSAYVAAILAQLEGVKHRLRPVRLTYSPPQTATKGQDRQTTQESGKLSPQSALVLRRIAEGRTYEQILKLHPELTYPDIFAAAHEALEAAGE